MIKNKAEFDFYSLAAIFGTDCLYNFQENFSSIGVSIDSRSIESDNIFVALRGEKIDGHTKILEAYEKNASCCIAEESERNNLLDSINNKPIIFVKDTLVALGELSKYHRQKFQKPVIAVAGSNGKTTTKEMIAHVLSSKYNILKTHENFNNRLGVPLMLLSLDDSYDCAVLEIGTNEPGEIEILSKILQPTYGIITNIGREHLEGFGDLDGVELEETYLFGYLMKNSGTALINFDDQRLSRYIKIIENRFVFGCNQECDLFSKIELDENLHPKIELNLPENILINITLSTVGLTTAYNAIAAAAVGYVCCVTPNEIKSSLESYEMQKGHGYARMLVENINGITLINDCYNANPDSMEAALNTLRAFNLKKSDSNKNSDSNKKTAVLGDMRELGKESLNEHILIINKALQSADTVLLTGNEMKSALNHINFSDDLFYKIYFFDEKSELNSFLKNNMNSGDIVLIKASRGMKMEEVIESVFS